MAWTGRALRELRSLLAAGPEGYTLDGPGDDIGAAHAIHFGGPEGSPHAGRTLTVAVSFPPRYPFEPPTVQFTTPVHHPNIDGSGRICLDLLRAPPKGSWRPTVSLISVLNAVRVLLGEPNPDDPLMPEIAQQYLYDREAYVRAARGTGVKADCNAKGNIVADCNAKGNIVADCNAKGNVVADCNAKENMASQDTHANSATTATKPSLLSLRKRRRLG